MNFPIHEIFSDTIQGEGYYSGVPADFIRLYGCPVGCWFCDTGYQEGGPYYQKQITKNNKSLDELLDWVKSPLVVLTGGEPMIHKNLPLLCDELLKMGKIVSVETSGSYWQEVSDQVWVTLSPKEHISPKFPVLDNYWKRANEFKLVVFDGTELDYYKPRLEQFKGLKYLSPEYESKESDKIAIDLLLQNKDFRISIQKHKYLNLR